ncbi:MAG TPA: hypothetical protein PKN32_13425 [Bacteroidales bacterium]|nr:hypothetical protein [Bacteroidales bacterium]
MDDKLQIWLAKMNPAAKVTYEQESFCLTSEEIQSQFCDSNYWHSTGQPSSWLVQSIVSKVKYKFRGKLPRNKAIELSAFILQISTAEIESALDWNANYNAWHDGRSVEDCHVWLKDE